MSNNTQNNQGKKIKIVTELDDDDSEEDEKKEKSEIKKENNTDLENRKEKNEIDSPYYSDEVRKIYKISSSPIISEISIITAKSILPSNRCYLTAEFSKKNNSIICIGGSDDKCVQYNKITEYDLSRNIWRFWKGNEQSEMGIELSGHSSNLITLNGEEKIFLFGGYDNWKKEFTGQSYFVNIKLKNFEKINYYNSFDNNNELPLPRTYHSSNYDKDKNVIYIYGGTDMNINHCKGDNFKSLWKFDLINKTWYKINLEINSQKILSYGVPRGHSSILLNDKLFIFGGVYSFKKFENLMNIINIKEKKVEALDYNKDSFKKGCIPDPIAFHSAVLLDEKKILIHGGLDKRYNAVNTCYVFHINEMKFDKINIDLIPNLFGHKIVMNSDMNKLYIIGGMDSFKYVGDENLIYKIERDQDYIFNKGKVEFFPMKNILEISLKKDLVGESLGETPPPCEEKTINKNKNSNPNKRIRWKKLFYVNI